MMRVLKVGSLAGLIAYTTTLTNNADKIQFPGMIAASMMAHRIRSVPARLN